MANWSEIIGVIPHLHPTPSPYVIATGIGAAASVSDIYIVSIASRHSSHNACCSLHSPAMASCFGRPRFHHEYAERLLTL